MQPICFNLTRHDIPINEYPLEDPIETGISTSRSFVELKALSIWGAGLDELRAWKNGEIDKSLLDLAVWFYIGDIMYDSHRKDAVAIEQHNRAKKAKK